MSDLRLSRLQKWVLQFLYTEAQGITMKQLWQGKDKEEIEDGREEFGGPSIWYYPGQKEKGGIK